MMLAINHFPDSEPSIMKPQTNSVHGTKPKNRGRVGKATAAGFVICFSTGQLNSAEWAVCQCEGSSCRTMFSCSRAWIWTVSLQRLQATAAPSDIRLLGLTSAQWSGHHPRVSEWKKGSAVCLNCQSTGSCQPEAFPKRFRQRSEDVFPSELLKNTSVFGRKLKKSCCFHKRNMRNVFHPKWSTTLFIYLDGRHSRFGFVTGMSAKKKINTTM